MVLHDASRTGAPLLALRWAQWATTVEAADVRVWFDRDGPLADASRTGIACQTRGDAAQLADRARGLWRSPAFGSIAQRVGRPRSGFEAPPIVVANTVAAWRTAASVRQRTRLVAWIHELDGVADQLLPVSERQRLLAETDHLIAAGDRVGAMLTERWRVPAAKVTVVDPFLDDATFDSPLPTGRHDVVAIGSLIPRKGPDAFVSAVELLHSRHPRLRAAWVGGGTDSPTAELVRHDIAAAGLDADLDLPGEVADTAGWLPRDGLLLHTAREDPAPLAVLEAAASRVPVVTWDTGGAADLLRSAGLGDLVAPAGDLIGLAERADRLLGDAAQRRRAGGALHAAARSRTTSASAPALLAAVCGVSP